MNPTAPDTESIFYNAAQRKSPAERAAYLAETCRDNEKLRAQLERLLRAYDEAGDFLGGTDAGGLLVTDDGPHPTADPDLASTMPAGPHRRPEQPGEIIGRYKLLQQIGEGGFGSVFMAEQREPVVRKVALKVIKLGMDTRQVIARFEAERQALALMDHPNIAKVFDAGATDSGRPYFVMELVRGDPITHYCDKNNLDVASRLELFQQICHAVQHAHQKGIIHRDIKPSNVLVTLADGKPLPKVIDFGIAKATSARLTEKTLFTEHRMLIGTPEYMSPEQAEMTGVDIDTRSDIYSLGVLLYELLTGATPFDSRMLRSAGYGEIQRIIREVEPPKPSTRLSTMKDSLASVAAQRRIDPSRLSRMLRGDLDWIVMKTLEKDRTRRYETANGLAADIQRHLDDEPVVAGPPSTGYKIRKFMKRNRAQVIAGGVVATVLLLGVIGTATGLVWALNEKTKATLAAESEANAKRTAQQNEQRAIAEAQRATESQKEEARARRRAEATVEFVTTALQAGDAENQGGGQDVTILAAMENAIKDLDSGRFDNDPDIAAHLKYTIATILENNGNAARAESLCADALETVRRFHPGEQRVLANCMITLSTIRLALGRAADAEPLAMQSVEIRKRLYNGDHFEIAQALNGLAAVRAAQGRLTEAEKLYREALEMQQRLSEGDDPGIAGSLNNVALALQEMGRLAEAEPLLVQSLEMKRRLDHGDSPGVALGLHSLAFARQSLGRNAEAEPLYAESLEMWRRLYKGDHPQISRSLNNLAGVREALGRSAEAESLAVEALEMQQRLYKSDHPDVAKSLGNVAFMRMGLGRVAEAEPLFAQALEMHRRLHPGDHPDTAVALGNLATARLALGRPAEAEPLLVESLEMNRRLVDGNHPSTATALSNLARTRHALGKTAEARQGFDDAIAMFRAIAPDGSPQLARVLWRSASARLENGDATAALAELEESVALAAKFLPSGHPHLTEYRNTLARCKAELSKQAETADDRANP